MKKYTHKLWKLQFDAGLYRHRLARHLKKALLLESVLKHQNLLTKSSSFHKLEKIRHETFCRILTVYYLENWL
ncbi:hypothetical protein RUMHYD_01636 [Blautia hydrogenotrophica DSM 10507]|uniref:Uncharacterized protein n=1 Tax=Blautia hydrogenotrophica (strain DSM 10507 / JCM 14656 / S5a33) TaxID=476272 RepID=C0CLB5_BLAHS|nr:hypothetical protein RUMHYD_01636 [Blautia hydrogenotrophica DSM 10507]